MLLRDLFPSEIIQPAFVQSRLVYIIVAVLMLGPILGFGQGVQVWAQRYGSNTDSEERAQKVIADHAGNVVIGGYTDTGDAGKDMLIIKYSSMGVPLWTNRYNGPGNGDDIITDIALNSQDTIFVTGYSLNTAQNYDYATIAYSANGMPLWTNRYNGTGNAEDHANSIRVNGGGTVFVTGYSFGGDSTGFDYATIAYSSEGVPLWTNRYNGPWNSDDIANALAVDALGHVFVTGHSANINADMDYLTIAYSEGGVGLWTNRYSGQTGGHDDPHGIAVDDSGNVFVTGESQIFASLSDYLTIAYSSAGVALWTNRYNGQGYDYALAVAVGTGGNVFVTGYADGGAQKYRYTTISYSNAGIPLWTNSYGPSVSGSHYAQALAIDANGRVFVTGYSPTILQNDYATVAYSDTGMALWTNRYDGGKNAGDYATSIAVSGSGQVFVTGYSTQGGASGDIATLSYSNEGQPLWTNRYSGLRNANDYPQSVAVDSHGNVIVSGYSDRVGSYCYSTIAFSRAGVPLWTNLLEGPAYAGDLTNSIAVDANGNVFLAASAAEGGSDDFVTVAYSSAGVPLWTNVYGGGFGSVPTAIVVDGSDRIVVTGNSQGAGSGYDYATVAYANTGTPLWTNRYNGPGNQGDFASAVVVDDNSGTVFVTGSSWGAGYEYATIAYSTNGVTLWANRYKGPGSGANYATDMAVDKNGNVFVTGLSSATNGASDYATVAYSKSGSALWTNRYDGPGPSVDIARAVTVDPNGRIYVTGSSSAGAGGYDYATVAYALSGAGLWTNRYSGPANGSDNAIAIVADSETVYVTGASASSNTSGISDFATVAYSSNGVPLWTNRYDGPANGDDKPLTRKSLAIAGPGSIVVVGASDGDSSSNTAYDYAIVKYASFPEITATVPSNGVVQLSWKTTFLGWRLEAQTNSGQGINTNWVSVPESAFTNLIIVPAAGGSGFFRLALP